MSDLGFNKIAAAVLATGLAISGLSIASEAIFPVEQLTCGEADSHGEDDGHHKELRKAGYCPPLPEVEGAGPPELAPDWGTVIPLADLAVGQSQFNGKCGSCHKATDENGTGPGLAGIVGRRPAAHPGFTKYSAAIQEYAGAHPQWTFDELNEFIKAPRRHMPGTGMTFVGIPRDTDQRVAIVAYLHSLGGSLPLPAPDPSRQPQAPGAEAAPAEGAAMEPATAADASHEGH